MEQVRRARLSQDRASERVPIAANPLEPLSEREREIVRLVSTGLSNKEIGLMLGISHWTVSTHLRRVFAKLEVTRRIELCYFSEAIGRTASQDTRHTRISRDVVI